MSEKRMLIIDSPNKVWMDGRGEYYWEYDEGSGFHLRTLAGSFPEFSTIIMLFTDDEIPSGNKFSNR